MPRGPEGQEPNFFKAKGVRNLTEEEVTQRERVIEGQITELRNLVVSVVNNLPKETIRPVQVPQYRQRDPSGCFFADLIAAKVALSRNKQPHNEMEITAQARSRGLMDDRGAFTYVENYEELQAFVRENLGLNVSFINRADEAIFACTEGVSRGKMALFGLPGHWVLLHALDNRTGDPTKLESIAMDPMRDQPRQISIDTIIERLGPKNTMERMPLVVVDGLAEDESLFSPNIKFRTPSNDNSMFTPKFQRRK